MSTSRYVFVHRAVQAGGSALVFVALCGAILGLANYFRQPGRSQVEADATQTSMSSADALPVPSDAAGRPAASGERYLVAQRTRTEGPPFPVRLPAPEFPADATWANTSKPLQLKDLKGKFVLLDFWTYCCINCQHVLPTLHKLEKAYPNELVVIGVHSAKFDEEQEAENIEQAVLRHGIEHPVINDAGHGIWKSYGVRAWPTIVLIDPEGFVVAKAGGEFKFEAVDAALKAALPYYRKNRTLDTSPLEFDLLAGDREPTPLKFPGKVLADEAGGRLFIADSSHHRIVVTQFDGTLLEVIGSGREGLQNGDFATAEFNHLQGMALQDDTLYVADTENHCIRKVDLAARRVATAAGTGQQADNSWPGFNPAAPAAQLPRRFVGRPRVTSLASPWALLIHKTNLYIAMAGSHQIWRMTLNEREIGPYAGNGREDIVDGLLLPRKPYEAGFSSFAQPSGLTTDGETIYVADSEGSSIRGVPLNPTEQVATVVGTSGLPSARLFTFGDRDGSGREVLLQHPLGVVWHDGRVYIADTYNNKIKVLDPERRSVATIAGSGDAGSDDGVPGEFDEPAGLTYAAGKLYVADTNNHRIRTVDLENGNRVATLEITGLQPPAAER